MPEKRDTIRASLRRLLLFKRAAKPRPRFPAWLVAVVLALAAIALYWPATGYDFVNYDDPAYFSENEHVLEGLTWRNLAWAFQTTLDASWYPVSWLSLMLDAEIFGRGPAGPHLTNLLLHAVNGVLLFLLWERLTGSRWRSALVAGLFALHPLHVESVAWVSERKDVLSTFFGLLTLIAYARYAQAQGLKSVISNQWSVTSGQSPGVSNQGSVIRGRASRVPATDGGRSTTDHGSLITDHRLLITDHRLLFYFLALVFFVLGLLSKPMLVTWPFVMLLLDYWPLDRLKLNTQNSKLRTLLPLLVEKIPFFVLALLASIVNVVVHKQVGALAPLASVSMSARIANAFVSYARYLGQTFWPTNLAIPYLHPGHWPFGLVCLGAALVASISALVLLLGRWDLVRTRSTASLTSSEMNGTRWNASLPALESGSGSGWLVVGWLWFLGTLVPVIGLIQWGNQAMADRFMYVPSVGLFVVLAWGLGEVVARWRVPKTAAGSVAALALLALALRSRDQLGYWRNGETLFKHTIEVTENNPLARNNLGVALVEKGRADEAISQFQEAIRLSPDEAYAHYNLGNALLKKGQIEAAISQLQEAVRLKPNSAAIHCNLGNALLTKGQTDEAIRQFQEAIRLQPAYPEALGTLAGMLDGQGEYAEAVRCYQTALKAQPGQEGALNNLAWLLATCPDAAFRNGPEAVRLATRACELAGYAKPLLIGTLAAAQAEAGDFPAAIATAERAVTVATAQGQGEIAMKNRELLQLYRQGQPFHERGRQPQMDTDEPR